MGKEFPQIKHIVLITAIALIVSAFSVFYIDQSLTEFLRFDAPRWLRSLAKDITWLGRAEIYYVLVIGLWIFTRYQRQNNPRWQKLYAQASSAILALAFTSLATTSLKIVFGRMRPKFELGFDPLIFEPGSFNYVYHSIPSGHTTMVFSVFAILSFYNKKLAYLWLPFAVAIAFSRVVVADHYLADIVFGSCVGFLAARFALRKWAINSR